MANTPMYLDVDGGYVYVLGSDLYLYQGVWAGGSTYTWTPSAKPIPMTISANGDFRVMDGVAYYAEGDSAYALSISLTGDFSTNTWKPYPPLPVKNMNCLFASLYDERILIGSDQNGGLFDLDREKQWQNTIPQNIYCITKNETSGLFCVGTANGVMCANAMDMQWTSYSHDTQPNILKSKTGAIFSLQDTIYLIQEAGISYGSPSRNQWGTPFQGMLGYNYSADRNGRWLCGYLPGPGDSAMQIFFLTNDYLLHYQIDTTNGIGYPDEWIPSPHGLGSSNKATPCLRLFNHLIEARDGGKLMFLNADGIITVMMSIPQGGWDTINSPGN